jgi:hypothetical protein
MIEIPDFLRPVAREDGTLEGTLHDCDGGYIALPSWSGGITLDGDWTPAQLRAIADYAEHLEAMKNGK